jgi:hypothetical protein
LRLCIIAVGAQVGSPVRNTAVPGTRCGGFFSKVATSGSSGTSLLRVFSNNSRLPRRQVYITTITRPPSASGTQPPSSTFKRLAPKNDRSISRNGPIRAAAASAGQRQALEITTKAIIAVTTMVPETAMP